MKTLATSILLAAILPAAAQQPKIIDFTADGFVTWTNPDTNAFYATDWTWNLRYNWIHADASMRATQSVMQTYIWDVGGDVGGVMENVFVNLRTYAEAFGDAPSGLFVRICTSPTGIGPSSVTNWLRVSNASTSVLENVMFGIETGTGNREWSAQVAALPPQSNTAFHAFSFLWPYFSNPFGAEAEATRYFIAYTQSGQHRDLATLAIMPVGPLRKDITFIVSNSSYTVSMDWLPTVWTTEY